MDITCIHHKNCGLDYCTFGVDCPEYRRKGTTLVSAPMIGEGIDLAVCPFCGSKAEFYSECEMIKARCSNQDCEAQTICWFDEPEEAAEEWNRRHNPS